MPVFSYELDYDGVQTVAGTQDSECASAHAFFLHLSAKPYPTTRVHIRVWVGGSRAGHPVVDQPRRRIRSLQAVPS